MRCCKALDNQGRVKVYPAPSTFTYWHGSILKMQLCTCWRGCRDWFSSYGKPEDGLTSHWKCPTIIRHEHASSGYAIFENLSKPLGVEDGMAFMEMPTSYFRPPWSRSLTELLTPCPGVITTTKITFYIYYRLNLQTPPLGIQAPLPLTLLWAPDSCTHAQPYHQGWCLSTQRTWTTRPSGLLPKFAKKGLWYRCSWPTDRRHQIWRGPPLMIYISPTSPSSSTRSRTALAPLNTTISTDASLFMQEKEHTLRPMRYLGSLEAPSDYHTSTETFSAKPNAVPATWPHICSFVWRT